MFIGEKAKAFRVLQSLSFTTTNLNGKMSLKIDLEGELAKDTCRPFAAPKGIIPSRSALCTERLSL